MSLSLARDIGTISRTRNLVHNMHLCPAKYMDDKNACSAKIGWIVLETGYSSKIPSRVVTFRII